MQIKQQQDFIGNKLVFKLIAVPRRRGQPSSLTLNLALTFRRSFRATRMVLAQAACSSFDLASAPGASGNNSAP